MTVEILGISSLKIIAVMTTYLNLLYNCVIYNYQKHVSSSIKNVMQNKVYIAMISCYVSFKQQTIVLKQHTKRGLI